MKFEKFSLPHRGSLLAAVLLAAALVGLQSPLFAADPPGKHEASLEARLARLEARIAELERALDRLRAEPTAPSDPWRVLEQQIDVLAREVERLKLGESAAAEGFAAAPPGLGPAASRVYTVARGVSLAGYGEALYENFDSQREDGAPSGRTDQLDFLRAIVYLGHKFSDRILFNSEIEFEHASTGKKGEVSVEFAYLDFLIREGFNVRAGMVLVPMGFVNELHEPPIFLGAARPVVEQRLIPTTWRENGVGVHGEAGPVDYRAYLVTSLAAVAGTSSGASGFSASGIRGGRSSGSRSAADDLALVARLDWQPRPWLTLGASAYTGDTGQGRTTPGGTPIDGRTTIRELHAELRHRALQARGLYTRTNIEDVAQINEAQGFAGSASIGERQWGGYVEVGYDVLAHVPETHQALIPYVRWERLDTQARVPAGFSADPANDLTVVTLGAAWKPILNVALKADFNRIENGAGTGVDQFNLALGFLF